MNTPASQIEFHEFSDGEPLTDSQYEQQITHDIAQFYDDFNGFVMYAFPWGMKDTELEEHEGPDIWQKEQQDRVSAKIKKDPEGTIREAISSGHGIGKGLTCDSIAYKLKFNLAQKGEVEEMEKINWGDLKKDDFVFGANGKPTKIVATNRYRREHFRVTFDDRSSVVVSGEHEWAVKGRQERRNKLDEWRILETQEILDLGVKRANGSAQTRHWEIPVQKAVEFSEADLNVHPYFMGLWLGDGCRNSPRYVKPFPELAERLCEVSGYHTSYAAAQRGQTRVLLRSLGVTEKEFLADPVFSKHSQDRYIPKVYKFASIEQRIELFRGLCDSDGEANKSGSIGYSSASKQLVEDIVWLARSLGCKAMMQPAVKKPVFTDAKGNKVKGRDCYRATINCSFNPFTHPKRKLAYKVSEDRYQKRWIESIESVGMQEGMCITVAAKDHLYLTDDFIVTHNSAEVAWIILWAMSTRPHLAGVITANTTNQLNTKTWRELALWHKRMINAHWFKWTATKFFNIEHPETWFCSATPNTEHNSEAFAGLHGTHVLIIYDEASGVPDKIWEVSEGAMTDPRAMHFVFGNPTRNTGKFRDIFANDSRWARHQIDSRTCKMTNKKEINEQIAEYGEDSDFCRVRIKGQFPRAGSMQFISSEICDIAMLSEAAYESFFQLPIVLGVDVARFGEDKSVIAVRQGRKVIELQRYRDMDTMQIAAKTVSAIREYSPAVVFVDGVGIGAGVVDRLRMLGHDIIEVNAGHKPDDDKTYYNKRAEMWDRMRIQMREGMDIPNDADLRKALIGVEYGFDDKERMRLERKQDMKKRGLDSPDDGDAIAYTYAELIGDSTQRYFEPEDHFEEEVAA